MRDHHTPISCGPSRSDGCVACMRGHAPTNATTGPRSAPMPSPIGSRIGRSARIDIRKAAPKAIATTTSMPGTHWTVTVDFDMATVRRRTSTADQKRPPPSHSRVRSQTTLLRMPSSNPSGLPRTVSGDTYRIARPHEASEIVALPNHVQVHVLSEIEAHVLLRTAKARDVEIEDD